MQIINCYTCGKKMATDISRKHSGSYHTQDLTESKDRENNKSEVELVVARTKVVTPINVNDSQPEEAVVNNNRSMEGLGEYQRDTQHEDIMKQVKRWTGLIIPLVILLVATLVAILLLVVCISLFSSTVIGLHNTNILGQATSMRYNPDPVYRVYLENISGYITGQVLLTTENKDVTLALTKKEVQIISKNDSQTNISLSRILSPVEFYSHGNVSVEGSVIAESDGYFRTNLTRYDLQGVEHVVNAENTSISEGQEITLSNYTCDEPGYYKLTTITYGTNGDLFLEGRMTRTITYSIVDPDQTFENNCTVEKEASCNIPIPRTTSPSVWYGIVLLSLNRYDEKTYQVQVSGSKLVEVVSFPAASAISMISLCGTIGCLTFTCKKKRTLRGLIQPTSPDPEESIGTNESQDERTKLIVKNR